MRIPNQIWKCIRDQFSDAEKALLLAAVESESICPPALLIDAHSLHADLRLKLEAAIAHANPGA